VWAEFLRLELHYGTADGFDNVMRRSLQNMDEKKMYNEIVKLYVSRDRIEVCFAAMTTINFRMQRQIMSMRGPSASEGETHFLVSHEECLITSSSGFWHLR